MLRDLTQHGLGLPVQEILTRIVAADGKVRTGRVSCAGKQVYVFLALSLTTILRKFRSF